MGLTWWGPGVIRVNWEETFAKNGVKKNWVDLCGTYGNTKCVELCGTEEVSDKDKKIRRKKLQKNRMISILFIL